MNSKEMRIKHAAKITKASDELDKAVRLIWKHLELLAINYRKIKQSENTSANAEILRITQMLFNLPDGIDHICLATRLKEILETVEALREQMGITKDLPL